MKRPGCRYLLPALGAACLAAMLAMAAPGAAVGSLTPYLQAVTANSVYVLVECDSKEPATVDYGPTAAYGGKAGTESVEPTSASPATYVHNVKLAGLMPNTAYHYRASQGGDTSADHAFTTAAEPGTSFRFAWMADCRTQPAIHDEIAGRIRGEQPRFSLYGGDLCANGQDYAAWRSEFFVQNQLALAAGAPFFNAVGNHEHWLANTQAFTQAPDSPSNTQAYYSFDYGDSHFVCLNNEVSYTSGSPQFEFVAKDLVSTKKTWKIVFSHKPAYSLGGNGEDLGMKVMSTYIFEPCGVDLVISGHNHFYQHSLVRGLHHLIIGSAGAPVDEAGTGSYVVRASTDHNYAIIDVTPGTLHVSVYNGKGAIIEDISLAKSGGPAGEPIVLPSPPPPLPPLITKFITRNSTWKYSAGGKPPDPSWKERAFADAPWPSGNGPLGFGAGSIKTALPAGRMAYYFRKVFTLSEDPLRITKLTLSVNYNDGFVLYLNGQEIARRGLPAGPVTPDTPAMGHPGGSYEEIDLTPLIKTQLAKKGPYLLAVEVHQKAANDGSLVWDADLVCESPTA